MRNILFLAFLIFLTGTTAKSQDFKKPAEGKTMVYFVRYQGAVAVLDFKYFDGTKYLGKTNVKNYFPYECEPGEHVFWVTAENKEFIKGDLKPNEIYVIEVRPYMRAVQSGVELNQISPSNKKALKNIKNLMELGKKANMLGLNEDQSVFIEEGMKRYKKIESKVTQIDPELVF